MASLHLAQEIIDILWPVGSVYISTDASNPSNKFGGTWSQITGGFIYGTTSTSGTKGTTGNTGTTTNTGKASGNTGSTTLTTSQIPSHSHTYYSTTDSGNTTDFGLIFDTGQGRWTAYANQEKTTVSTGGGGGHTHTLNSHQHTIPYIVCYVWKRTA